YRLPATSKFVIPHPLISEAKPKLMPGERFAPEKIIKIGVVGIIRQDKPIAEVIKKIQEYLNSNPSGCELVIGTPLAEKPTWLDELNAQLYDTTEESDYIKVLQEIDILVIHYQPERYYYRTSGVISDAASCGCYIIASDYPVIKHQINYPVTIGATFQDFAEIPSLIAKGITSIQKNGKDANWQWREKRTAEAIAAILTA
ncbi:MAG: glycosyltransferase family 1 protein, partial [Cyanobacteria bacterium J083]